ncbi:MAG: RHS repeat-associated core domain-containing protein [Acidobacteria bacterium]|nr:RHS repeat-associated core domain-containing protein [Acidobacteriota bacterium]
MQFASFAGTTQLVNDNQSFPQIDPASNRFNPNQGYLYDKNGNLIANADGLSVVFNGENKQSLVLDQNNHPIGRYFYDGEGRRIKKVTDLETTVFVYDASSKLIAEYSNQTPQNPNTSYVATDTLLSVRLVTDKSGNVVSRRDFKPFGEDLAADQTFRKKTDKYSTATEDKVRQRFTGYQKDIETGLDFAEARMYENRHGRFTAVDPLLASGKSANPQTFNRYTYVLNSPLVNTDPTGLQTTQQRVGAWYIPDQKEANQRYRHPRFISYDEPVPSGYSSVLILEHVYFNKQQADEGEAEVWTLLHPFRFDQRNFKTKEEAISLLESFFPKTDVTTAESSNGFLNTYGGATFGPRVVGLGVVGGMVFDLDESEIMPQLGLAFSIPAGPLYNATYSPEAATDGWSLSGGASVTPDLGQQNSRIFPRLKGAGAISNNVTPEFGVSSPGITIVLMNSWRQGTEFNQPNSAQSEQSLRPKRKAIGLPQPFQPCQSMRCNSSTNVFPGPSQP